MELQREKKEDLVAAPPAEEGNQQTKKRRQMRKIQSTHMTTAHPRSYSALKNSIFIGTSSVFQSAGSFPKSPAFSSLPLSSSSSSVASMMGDKSLVTPGLVSGCSLLEA